ncbi:MAG: hypothetical protein H0V13_11980 [Nocardioidaceae bacterium]|jgi:hypothetical protein|nr:hypothetical protein [Nocardioidaceae bacterium]
MGRALWFAAGAGAGLWTTLKARRVVYRLTPEGVTDQVATWGLGARAFAEEVRIGMAEREVEIAHELALPPGDEVDSGRARAHGPVLDPRVHTGPRVLAASAADPPPLT